MLFARPAQGARNVFRSAQRGLGFRRAGPRILEAAWASEIDGGDRYRRSIRGIEIGTEVEKYRGSFPRFVRRGWFADSTPLLIHMALERTIQPTRTAIKSAPFSSE